MSLNLIISPSCNSTEICHIHSSAGKPWPQGNSCLICGLCCSRWENAGCSLLYAQELYLLCESVCDLCTLGEEFMRMHCEYEQLAAAQCSTDITDKSLLLPCRMTKLLGLFLSIGLLWSRRYLSSAKCHRLWHSSLRELCSCHLLTRCLEQPGKKPDKQNQQRKTKAIKHKCVSFSLWKFP